MTLDEWIINGSTGISSKTMWAVLKGLDSKRGDKPYDPDDFSRCYGFVKECDITNGALAKIAIALPYWDPYIENWDKLCDMYEANVKNNWKNHKEIGMFDFMQELRKQSDLIRKN